MTDNEEFKRLKNIFWQNYTNKVLPKLVKYEQKRHNVLFLIVGVICLAILITLYLLYRQIVEYIPTVFIVTFFFSHFIRKFYEKKVKTEIMPFVCSVFENLVWIKDFRQTQQYEKFVDLYNTGLVPYFNIESIDDTFIGSRGDVNFDIVETKYKRETGSGKSRHVQTVFKGVVIRFNMNKNFKGHTVIKPDTLMHFSPSSDLKHTELEDVEFEKKFDVYTDDEIEARYLITPSFMERIKNIQVAFNAENVSCAFYKNDLYLALHTRKDLFSLCSLTKTLYDSKQFEQIFNEIYSLIALIEYFKLEQKIGL